uniref:Uncharacterized protein n=1 Tax=Triticum urartu TaxID=4572 RepID=A0A8R7K0N4_TRIUA
ADPNLGLMMLLSCISFYSPQILGVWDIGDTRRDISVAIQLYFIV